jgi:F-box domain
MEDDHMDKKQNIPPPSYFAVSATARPTIMVAKIQEVQTTEESTSAFDSFGVLEQILSFVDTPTLLVATRVNRRWKQAGRHDDLWIGAIQRLWKEKKGVYLNSKTNSSAAKKGEVATSSGLMPRGAAGDCASESSVTHQPRSHPPSTSQQAQPSESPAPSDIIQFDNMIFWRSLFSKELVEKMTEDQIRCYFGHPLLEKKRTQLEQRLSSPDLAVIPSSSSSSSPSSTTAARERSLFLQRYVQLHMLDIMSDLTSEEVQQEHSFSLFGDDSDDDDDDDDDEHNHYDNERNTSVLYNRQRPRALPRQHFFSDLYFGSYACSVMDSHRNRMTQLELCRPFGFLLYFKVDANEVLEDLLERPDDDDDDGSDGDDSIDDDDDEEEGDDENDDMDDDGNYAQSAAHRGALEVYEGNPLILLYKHSICYFDAPDSLTDGAGASATTNRTIINNNNARNFRMDVLEHVEHAFTTDLQWRWAVNGSKVQVGPYPPLHVKRRHDDWGWEMENVHVVMRSLEHGGRHPTPRQSLPGAFVSAQAQAAAARRRRRRRRRRHNHHNAVVPDLDLNDDDVW